ncbi:spore cortex biosynthesis protein YabQ [Alicyclobacillus sp. ALC3]|uniref:spore cortex biosynthesis protein YabQ n=1 Tax=Alicyclobacillus sp. ALC3 TaxID=2796143 RepID=UPI002379AF5E|nr:spore cortex biosynthesis protein YabQ [Alicyclobacillus sp. ALC3]WDL98984.1 spore cortex biosynthesis protein YabQ [Alicyclobacillus sp. ALC3]
MSALQQIRSVLELVAAAALLGALFDVYNTVTGASKVLRFFRPVADLAFWLVAAVLVFFVLFSTDDGRLRLYTFPLLVIGYLLYRSWFHRRVVRSAFVVVRIVQAVLRFFWRIIYRLLIWPLQEAMLAVRFILRLVYRILCKAEDGVFWVMSFWWKVAFFPFRRWTKPVQEFRGKLYSEWEGILGQVSKWLIRTSKHT